jgi:hypothetical protein
MPRRARQNIYTHEIDLTNLNITNTDRDHFREDLERIAYRGYNVEEISDGRKIVITKPGGKFTFGSIRRDDFMVWIYNPADKTLWLISHKNILDDLRTKGELDPRATLIIIGALERVYNGDEPDEILMERPLPNPGGELPEVLLKAYKWIWGQEDVNYPTGKGRAMSWEGWTKTDGEWTKNGQGILDLREELKKSLDKSSACRRSF